MIRLQHLYLIVIVVLVFGPSVSYGGSVRKFKFCKLDYLLECFIEPIKYFTSQNNGTGLPANDEMFEQFCL